MVLHVLDTHIPQDTDDAIDGLAEAIYKAVCAFSQTYAGRFGSLRMDEREKYRHDAMSTLCAAIGWTDAKARERAKGFVISDHDLEGLDEFTKDTAVVAVQAVLLKLEKAPHGELQEQLTARREGYAC